VQRERWKRQPDGSWEYYEKTFIEYEHLARKWSDEAIVLDESYSGPPADQDAGGPGDEPLPPPPDGTDDESAKG